MLIILTIKGKWWLKMLSLERARKLIGAQVVEIKLLLLLI